MPLAPTWKTAKTAFETTTGKKKPSEKFMGVFRKGTGIESALKEVDGAKTAADVRKGLAKFNAAWTEYLKLLDKTAADPKTVPSADKPTYVTALGKLKAELQKMEADGEAMARSLDGAGGKDKVDPKVLKEANDHLKLRLQGQAESAALVKTFKGELASADKMIALAGKQLTAARSAGKKGGTLEHQTAVGVIDTCIDELETIARRVRSSYEANVTDNASTLMKARMDPSTEGLPKSVLDAYLPKSKEAFRKMSASTAELTSLLNEIENKVDEGKALLAQAEGAGNQLKDPKAYLAQLKTVLDEVTKERASIGIKGERIVKGESQIDKAATAPTENRLKLLTLQEGQWQRYEPDFKASAKRFASLGTQASALPAAAREDAAVDKAVSEVASAVQDGLAYLKQVTDAGAALLKRIQRDRAQLGG